jgi:hypothetical protein
MAGCVVGVLRSSIPDVAGYPKPIRHPTGCSGRDFLSHPARPSSSFGRLFVERTSDQ